MKKINILILALFLLALALNFSSAQTYSGNSFGISSVQRYPPTLSSSNNYGYPQNNPYYNYNSGTSSNYGYGSSTNSLRNSYQCICSV